MTAQEILTAAYSHAKKVQPGVTLVDATEGPAVIDRALRGLVLFGCQVNAGYFGQSVDVAYAAPGWKRPADALVVIHLSNAAGEDVLPVEYTERARFADVPAVWEWGQTFRPTGGAAGPLVNEALTILYARSPAQVANLAAAIDSYFPDDFAELLALEVVIYAALKDERPDAYLGALKAERDRWALRFVAYLGGATAGVARINDPVQIPGEQIARAAQLLAGGSSIGAG